jgi:hypothetical protein
MKSLIQAVAVAAALVVPVASFAQQSNAPLTRAQVRAELIQLENAGYRPGDGDQTDYPIQIQEAEAKVAAMNGQAGGYGGVAGAKSDAGRAPMPKVN